MTADGRTCRVIGGEAKASAGLVRGDHPHAGARGPAATPTALQGPQIKGTANQGLGVSHGSQSPQTQPQFQARNSWWSESTGHMREPKQKGQ